MRYIIYCRKSTDTEDKQVLSLESQTSELQTIAKKENLKVTHTFSESMSAKQPGRPMFNKVLNLISTGKADAILCWKIDRLTRNPIDGGLIQWMLQTEKLKCIKTFEKSYYPSDNVLLINIEQAMATQYLRDLSLNVKRGNRAKLEKGEWPNHAPLGYLNDKASKTVVLDSEKSVYIKKAFQLYASGGYTLSQVADALYSDGLRTNTGKKIKKNQIHRIINNKFYYGIMERNGQVFRGKHKPIITQDLFNSAQSVLTGKLHPRPKKHFYSARGFLKCAVCNCVITADTKKGFKYYYCTNGKNICQQHKKYIRSEKVDNLIAGLLAELKISPYLIATSEVAYRQHAKTNGKEKEDALNKLKNEAKLITEREMRLTDGYISNIIEEDAYLAKLEELKRKRIELELQKESIEKTEPGDITFEQVKKVILDGYFASERYKSLKERAKKTILEKTLSNISIKDENIVSFQFKSPYDILLKVPQNADLFEMLTAWDDIRQALLKYNINPSKKMDTKNKMLGTNQSNIM